ncbi:hypothetical protein RHSIM_Rhsim04G0042600 [Rhododendron simsii]|uniref:Uncharacterized protein n=1 Tax=Rhododendron simsii TaxID=118357 RepID=A0A834H541_RHOSS|nr:hypothetical protein RHSIM_Rhsim04G0042600 [Rhododendron simsii]
MAVLQPIIDCIRIELEIRSRTRDSFHSLMLMDQEPAINHTPDFLRRRSSKLAQGIVRCRDEEPDKYSNKINGRRWTSIVSQICPLLLSPLMSILLPVAALPFLFPQSNPLRRLSTAGTRHTWDRALRIGEGQMWSGV